MAKQDRTTLKGFFETGDIPNQSQYGDLIDSNLNLSDTNIQVATSQISASALHSETFISASGHIATKLNLSSSGLIVGGLDGDNNYAYVSASNGSIFVSGTGSFGQIIVTEYDDINLNGDLSASGNISASGYVSCSALVIAGSEIRGSGGDFTASGTIKATGFVGAITTTGVTSTGTGTFTDVNTGQGVTEVHLMNQNIRTSDAVTFTTVNTGQGANELYAMDQNVRQADAVTFATVNTGQGANELYDMNQNVTTTSAVTFATVNTGQGANELYDMNQNVLSTSSPTFSGITITSNQNGNGFAPGATIEENAQKNEFTKVIINGIASRANSEIYKVLNSRVVDSTTVVCSTNTELTVQVTLASESEGGYSFHFFNPTTSISSIHAGARVTCTLL